MQTWSVEAHAPLRICDLGGWTDTWFAGHGRVVNIGIDPGVLVRVGPGAVAGAVVIDLVDLGDRVEWRRDRPPGGAHALVEASVARGLRGFDPGPLQITIESAVPPGASMGTSASVSVALLGALHAVVSGGGQPRRSELAAAAHEVETQVLGQQSGIQDQLCAVHGGVSDIRMHRYPVATVRRLVPSGPLASALSEGLTVVYLGRPHDSSVVHEMVIADLEARGGDAPALTELREIAADGVAAIEAGDLDGLTAAMRRNTEAQRWLHPELVSPLADAVIDRARAAGARGWKVNGAGGDGGSLTLLSTDRDVRQRVDVAVRAAGPGVKVMSAYLGGGLRVVTRGQPSNISSASSG
ncbi:MAG: GHMP kinase [Acidimicrobiia bacterium]|nr:GHMP kinase [Acidimicrobiia bacterium]